EIDVDATACAFETDLGVAVADELVIAALAFEEVERAEVGGVRGTRHTETARVIDVGKATADDRPDPGEGVGSDNGDIAGRRAEGMTGGHVDGYAGRGAVEEDLRVAVAGDDVV